MSAQKAKKKSSRGTGVAKEWLLFQIATGVVGLGLVVLGMFGVFQGISILPGNEGMVSTPTLDSSFAFQSALVIGLGLSMLLVAARPAKSGLLLAALAGIVFLGGLARLAAWAIFGLPHALLVLSMVLELVIPPLLVVWRGWIERSQQLRGVHGPGKPSPATGPTAPQD